MQDPSPKQQVLRGWRQGSNPRIARHLRVLLFAQNANLTTLSAEARVSVTPPPAMFSRSGCGCAALGPVKSGGSVQARGVELNT